MVFTLLGMVFIGAVIGSFTNYIAIKMLFRPYRSITWGPFHLPFTPGLIPKRREEIAHQIGKMVEEYLMTEKAVKEAFLSPRMERELRVRMRILLRRLLKGKESLSQLGSSLGLPEWEAWVEKWTTANLDENRLVRLIAEQIDRYRGIPIGHFLHLPSESLDRFSSYLAGELANELQAFLLSSQGKRWVMEAIDRILAGRNPMWQWAAALFVREDRVEEMLILPLARYLGSPHATKEWEGKIKGYLEGFLEKNLQEVTGAETSISLASFLVKTFGLQEGVFRFFHRPAGEWGKRLYTFLLPLLPKVSQWILRQLNEEISGIYRTLHISRLVEKEVASYPLPKLEQMILEVTRRELKAITLLGGLLGGLIGLIQFLIMG
ncbi:MAG: DUF445 family protein [Thermicanus sp.]|nr:DUF445 family protein [Thermicanus sp.]